MDQIKLEADIILASMMPLLRLKSPATGRIMRIADLRWYACQYCPPNSRGKPGWYGSSVIRHRSFMVNAHYISSGVLDMMRRGDDNQKAILEHIVPHKIMIDHLYEVQPRTTDELRPFLIANLHVGFLTEAEDKRLNVARLTSKMPEDCVQSDRLARYRAAGIVGVQLRDFKTGEKLHASEEDILAAPTA